MLLIGLTGGIGSGKTSVTTFFANLGAAIVDTDIIARTVLDLQPRLLDQLCATFGDAILEQNGTLNRQALRQVAFANQHSKQQLDNIMHPAIRQQTLREIEQQRQANAHYCIVVVPLLIETDFKSLVDRILVVTAPEQSKLKWLKQRSGLNRDDAMAIIKTQSSDEEKLRYADDHIRNDKKLDDLEQQVIALHKHYLSITRAEAL